VPPVVGKSENGHVPKPAGNAASQGKVAPADPEGGEEPADVMITVAQRKEGGFGIHFKVAKGTNVIEVEKVEPGSEAEMAGVQSGDVLLRVQDTDGVYPPDAPGTVVTITRAMFFDEHLAIIRKMKHCKFFFRSSTAAKFQ